MDGVAAFIQALGVGISARASKGLAGLAQPDSSRLAIRVVIEAKAQSGLKV